MILCDKTNSYIIKMDNPHAAMYFSLLVLLAGDVQLYPGPHTLWTTRTAYIKAKKPQLYYGPKPNVRVTDAYDKPQHNAAGKPTKHSQFSMSISSAPEPALQLSSGEPGGFLSLDHLGQLTDHIILDPGAEEAVKAGLEPGCGPWSLCCGQV